MSIGYQTRTESAVATVSDRMICHCYGVTESELVDIIEAKQAETVAEVLDSSCAGSGCTACHCRIKRLIRTSSAGSSG
jgi:NAD(P)H-nitrite reductase large subunit